MRKIVLALLLLAISVTMMAGCGSSSGQKDSAREQKEENSSVLEELGNNKASDLWKESDKQGVAETTGFEMTAPDGATEVSYSYVSESKLAQMRYVLDGAKWSYRIQSADELTDISELEIKWMDKSEGNVAGKDAVYYAYTELNNEKVNDVQLVNWYDAVSGVTYSLSVFGTDLNGMDIQAYAENLYAPLQGEATDDPAKDREDELNNYFLGEHIKSDDESTLTISDNNDGTFGINISITRLCSLEDGVGTFDDHKMNFVATDPSGDKLTGVIYLDSDNSLTVKITNSTWTYLQKGDVIQGFGK